MAQLSQSDFEPSLIQKAAVTPDCILASVDVMRVSYSNSTLGASSSYEDLSSVGDLADLLVQGATPPPSVVQDDDMDESAPSLSVVQGGMGETVPPQSADQGSMGENEPPQSADRGENVLSPSEVQGAWDETRGHVQKCIEIAHRLPAASSQAAAQPRVHVDSVRLTPLLRERTPTSDADLSFCGK
jgi:hypothetical protein